MVGNKNDFFDIIAPTTMLHRLKTFQNLTFKLPLIFSIQQSKSNCLYKKLIMLFAQTGVEKNPVDLLRIGGYCSICLYIRDRRRCFFLLPIILSVKLIFIREPYHNDSFSVDLN